MAERHLTNEELSAYIDGEARRAEAVAAHIAACAECRRRSEELARLSIRLKALTPPDVHPAFLTRVVATAAETRPLPRRDWAALLPWASAALVVALALGAWAVFRGDEEPPAPGVAQAPAWPGREVDAEAMSEYLAARVAAYPQVLDDDVLPWSNGVEPQDTTDAMLAELAQADWFNAFANEAAADQDTEELIATLTPSEAEVLKELLSRYANEG